MGKHSRNLKLGGEKDWQHPEHEQVATSVNARLMEAYKQDQAFLMRVPYAIAQFRVPSLVPLQTKEFNLFRRPPALLGRYAVEAFLFEELPVERGLEIYAAVHERDRRVAIFATHDTVNGAAMRFGIDNEIWMGPLHDTNTKE